jgi:hypothetical protein
MIPPKTPTEYDGPQQVHRDDEAATIQPVGQHAGVQTEEQPRQALEQTGHGDGEWVLRLRSDQQGAGR